MITNVGAGNLHSRILIYSRQDLPVCVSMPSHCGSHWQWRKPKDRHHIKRYSNPSQNDAAFNVLKIFMLMQVHI